MGSTRIRIEAIGIIPEDFLRFIEGVLNDFYSRVDGPLFVEVYIYSTTYDKMVYMENLATRHGVAVVGDFITMHEAWSGWPRIHIDFESCSKLSKRYIKALLVHEATHSILHGSPLFYTIDIPPKLLENPIALTLIYLASTIAKDIDVYRFLSEKGFIDEIESYNEFIVEHQLEDRCTNSFEIYTLAKMLIPCLYIERCKQLEILMNCRDIAMTIIKKLKAIEKEIIDLDLSKVTLKIFHTLQNLYNESQ